MGKDQSTVWRDAAGGQDFRNPPEAFVGPPAVDHLARGFVLIAEIAKLEFPMLRLEGLDPVALKRQGIIGKQAAGTGELVAIDLTADLCKFLHQSRPQSRILHRLELILKLSAICFQLGRILLLILSLMVPLRFQLTAEPEGGFDRAGDRLQVQDLGELELGGAAAAAAEHRQGDIGRPGTEAEIALGLGALLQQIKGKGDFRFRHGDFRLRFGLRRRRGLSETEAKAERSEKQGHGSAPGNCGDEINFEPEGSKSKSLASDRQISPVQRPWLTSCAFRNEWEGAAGVLSRPVSKSDTEDQRMRHFFHSFLFCAALPLLADEPEAPARKGKYDMTYDELANLRIVNSASLTATEQRKVPASMTVITAEMIRHSGARNLGELLDMYVPDLQLVASLHPQIIHTRGITDIASDKYIILVNGVRMNGDFVLGNQTEFYISSLADLERVEFISGPGGAIYGHGATGGVINLITRDRLPEGVQEETRLSLSGGLIDRHSRIEASYLRRLNQAMTLHLYAGIEHYDGANEEIYYPRSYRGIPAGTDQSGAGVDSHAAAHSEPRIKLHMGISSDEFSSWLRYLRAGEDGVMAWKAANTAPAAPPGATFQYQQLTWGNTWKHELSDTTELEIGANMQALDYLLEAPALFGPRGLNALDWRSNLRPVLHWNPADEHRFALGGELTYVEYGHRSLLEQGQEPSFIGLPLLNQNPRWNELDTAIFGEYQWHPSDSFSLFLGGRIDQSKHAPLAFSPKIAGIFTPTEEDTLSLIFNRSSRRAGRLDQRIDLLYGQKGESPNEELESWEASYKRQLSEHWSAGLTLYYLSNKIITFNPVPFSQSLVGTATSGGLTATLSYHDDPWGFSLSHNINQLLDVAETPGAASQIALTSPYGLDDNFTHIANHNTKLQAYVKFTDELRLDAFLRVYWHYDGQSDFYDYSKTATTPIPGYTAPGDKNFEPFFGPITRFDMSLTWDVSPNHSLRLSGYNLLGLIDQDLNREVLGVGPAYLRQPVSFALTYEFKF